MHHLRAHWAPALAFVSAAVVTACIVQTQPQPAPGPSPYAAQPVEGQPAEGQPDGSQPAQAQPQGLRDGEYFCSLTNGEYSYPEFACVVYHRRDGQQVLEKLAGSQRIHGVVTPSADGFEFRGTFFCPWGSCTEEVSARFVARAPDIYEGTLFKNSGSSETVVRLRYLPMGLPRGYGGYGYGGVGYARAYGRGAIRGF